jgi:hypothetical protein
MDEMAHRYSQRKRRCTLLAPELSHEGVHPLPQKAGALH